MQKNFIFSDTETTGLWEKDFIQIIQSASILTDESFKRVFKGSSVKRTKFIGLKRNIDQNKYLYLDFCVSCGG